MITELSKVVFVWSLNVRKLSPKPLQQMKNESEQRDCAEQHQFYSFHVNQNHRDALTEREAQAEEKCRQR